MYGWRIDVWMLGWLILDEWWDVRMDGFLCIYILNLIELFFVDFPSMKCSPLPVHLFRLRLRLVFGSGQQKVDRCNNDDVTSARMGRQSGFHLVQSAYWKRFKDVCTDGFVLSSWLTCECTFLFLYWVTVTVYTDSENLWDSDNMVQFRTGYMIQIIQQFDTDFNLGACWGRELSKGMSSPVFKAWLKETLEACWATHCCCYFLTCLDWSHHILALGLIWLVCAIPVQSSSIQLIMGVESFWVLMRFGPMIGFFW